MDITSYLLGKNSTGGGGGSANDFFTMIVSGGSNTAPGILKSIKALPDNMTVTGSSLGYAFAKLNEITKAPLLDTSSVTGISYMFDGCTNLQSIPAYDTSSITGSSSMTNTFRNCAYLTDESLNNILKMCINATSYTGTKTLAQLGISSTYYPVERIQALPNYQAFIDTGWTIGY